jgi:hypothetical protein
MPPLAIPFVQQEATQRLSSPPHLQTISVPKHDPQRYATMIVQEDATLSLRRAEQLTQ